MIWASIKFLHHRDGKSAPKNQTHGSIIRFKQSNMSAILNLIMFLKLSSGLRYCTEFGTSMVNYASMTDDMFKLKLREVDFGFFMVLDNGCWFFRINFYAKTIRLLLLYYNFIFNLYEFTLPLETNSTGQQRPYCILFSWYNSVTN